MWSQMETNEKIRKLKKLRVKVTAIRKYALTFGEEVKLNGILYAIDEAVRTYDNDG